MDKEKLIADIKAMSVLELADLVKALEEEFGVSAAATAVAVAGPAAQAAPEAKAKPQPEDDFDIDSILTEFFSDSLPSQNGRRS